MIFHKMYFGVSLYVVFSFYPKLYLDRVLCLFFRTHSFVIQTRKCFAFPRCGFTPHKSIKKRILGQRGHLSNYDAASLVRRYANARLKKLFLAHLSGECNASHIAEGVMRSALAESCAAGVPFETLSQDSISSFTC